jgi:hypothetical protein
MYGLWGITHQQADAQMRVLRFVKAQFTAGKGDLLTAQFVAYRDFKKLSEERLHSWKTYLGSEGRNYSDGAWNAQDWPTTLMSHTQSQERKPRLNNGPPPAPANASVSISTKKSSWR